MAIAAAAGLRRVASGEVFRADKVLPYLATRGCYWVAASSETMVRAIRPATDEEDPEILDEIRNCVIKYGARHFSLYRRIVPAGALSKAVAWSH